MFDQIIPLLGVALDQPAMQDFLAEHGFKPPKKSEISGRASDRSFWLEHKKLGLTLLFSIDTNNPLYSAKVGSKKGMWIPLLQQVNCSNNNLSDPYHLHMGLTLTEAKSLLREPHYKSSDFSKVWLNDDGTESFYGWNIPIDADRQTLLSFRIKTDGVLKKIDLGLKELTPVQYLYDPLIHETMHNLLGDPYHSIENAVFLEWSIQQGLYQGSAQEQETISKVKSGTLNGIDFLMKYPEKSRIFKEEFAPQHQTFVHKYCNNLSGHDVLYSRDFAFCFLKEPALRQNYMGIDATESLKQLHYTEENKNIVFDVLNQRMAEFNQHGFSKSQHIR
jgi:hypothetical protein